MLIVAPAGELEKFYAAVDAGADEVYMGLKGFGARKSAKNFTLSEYIAAIAYAHERNTRVLLTLNTVMMDNEIEVLHTNLKRLYEAGLDAVIVQDLGMAKFLKMNFPDLELHASTQMTVSNHVEAEYLKNLGFSRVVPSRELNLEDIRKIKENCDIELEIFVSGSLCVSYSGKCFMSSFIGARSGNRGMCAQPCRKEYKSSTGESGYLLSPKDQLMGKEEIEALKEIGVESIKIEGRMKESIYVFELVRYYKELIGGSDSTERVSKIFNRGYSKGYFYDDKRDELLNRDYSFNLGKNIGTFSGKEVKLSDKIVFGDGVTFVSKDFEKLGGTNISKINIKGDKKRSSDLDKARVGNIGDTIIINDIPVGTRYLFKSYDKELVDSLNSEKQNSEKRVGIVAHVTIKVGVLPTVTFSLINTKGEKVTAEIVGENPVEVAGKRGATRESVLEKLSELGDTTFYLDIENSVTDIDENAFMPLSLLKNLKRECAELLSEKLLASYERVGMEIQTLEYHEDVEKELVISAIVKNEEDANFLKNQGIEKIYFSNHSIVKESNIDKIKYQGKLAYSMLDLRNNPESNLTTHWSMNVTNRYTLDVLSLDEKIETAILSPELSFEKIKNLGKSKVKKAVLIYSRPKVMHIEAGILKSDATILNDMGDEFSVEINEFGNSEIYLDKPLDITDRLKELRELKIDEVVLEFHFESHEEMENIIKGIKERKDAEKKGNGYNYWQGVY